MLSSEPNRKRETQFGFRTLKIERIDPFPAELPREREDRADFRADVRRA
jgi:hypothetical protein